MLRTQEHTKSNCACWFLFFPCCEACCLPCCVKCCVSFKKCRKCDCSECCRNNDDDGWVKDADGTWVNVNEKDGDKNGAKNRGVAFD